MSIISEFRDFAMKGNVVDMAVGVIIGAAFGDVVKSMVADVMMPPIGFVLGKMDFSKMSLKMEVPPVIPGDKPSVVEIMYGKFINVGIGFFITALCLFLIIKAMNAAKARFEKKKEVGAVEPPAQEKLLMEIRDLLKAKA